MSEYALYDRSEPALSGWERTVYDAITAEEPWALIERFADLERVSGTEAEERAAGYLIDRLEALGIPVERYDPELYISQPHDATVRATAPVEATFESAKTVSFSNAGAVGGEAVYLDPEADDELAGAFDVGLSIEDIEVDVEGKVVVMEALLPIKAIGELADAGAAAYVGIHPHDREPHEGIATPVWGGVPDPDGPTAVPDIAVANVSRTDGDALLETLRTHDTVELAVTTDVTTGWFECPVVLSRIPGEADPEADDFVLAHGHHDSWYVGVTDNATGDASLLECARVFNDLRDRFERDLWIAWWPGHSTGRYAGSTWFVDEFAHALNDRCVAHVNVDSPGVADATEYVGRVKWMPEADGLCRAVIADVAGKDTVENRPPRAGDYSFNNVGIPGMSLQSCIPEAIRDRRGYHTVGGSGGHADAWHLSTDTIEKADPEVLVRDTRVYALAIARLLGEDVLPLDHRRAVDRHLESIGRYQELAGEHFDLDPVEAALEDLKARTDAFYAAVEAGDIPDAVANETIKTLSRILTRVYFDSEGPFEQDPALYRPPYPTLAPVTRLPSLDGDAYRFRRVHLKRARNDVVHRLRTAIETIPEAV